MKILLLLAFVIFSIFLIGVAFWHERKWKFRRLWLIASKQDAALPAELHEGNPLGIKRMENGFANRKQVRHAINSCIKRGITHNTSSVCNP